mmetsp:Transcript_44188/g.96418  ORF Transcript_44188/g.96418 Transcript_44188/m.96418 type:complete len:254 (+) Transcript_44188:282-1043(+)
MELAHLHVLELGVLPGSSRLSSTAMGPFPCCQLHGHLLCVSDCAYSAVRREHAQETPRPWPSSLKASLHRSRSLFAHDTSDRSDRQPRPSAEAHLACRACLHNGPHLVVLVPSARLPGHEQHLRAASLHTFISRACLGRAGNAAAGRRTDTSQQASCAPPLPSAAAPIPQHPVGPWTARQVQLRGGCRTARFSRRRRIAAAQDLAARRQGLASCHLRQLRVTLLQHRTRDQGIEGAEGRRPLLAAALFGYSRN